jgi:hypothetical protein
LIRTTGTAQNADTDLGTVWLEQLIELRRQGMQIADINPVSALADIIGEQIDSGAVTVEPAAPAAGCACRSIVGAEGGQPSHADGP